jgi:hypothetical protein
MFKDYLDPDRKDFLNTLASLYGKQDHALIISRMPLHQEDTDGKEFQSYVEFLQRFYRLKSDIVDMNEGESLSAKLKLVDAAHKFRFPANTIGLTRGPNDL